MFERRSYYRRGFPRTVVDRETGGDYEKQIQGPLSQREYKHTEICIYIYT